MKKSIWLSYDLGVKGDYESLYVWLAKHKALECGDSFAYFKMEIKGDDIADSVKIALKQNVGFSKHDRVYIIWREHSKTKGRFLFGARKTPPWASFEMLENPPDEIG